MKVTLNGELKEIKGPVTLQSILDELNLPAGRVACEINLKIIRRALYTQTMIREGDEVEIIQAIGGG